MCDNERVCTKGKQNNLVTKGNLLVLVPRPSSESVKDQTESSIKIISGRKRSILSSLGVSNTTRVSVRVLAIFGPGVGSKVGGLPLV